jgi:hypothetical protein
MYCTARERMAPLDFSPEPLGTIRPSSLIPSLIFPLRRRSTSFYSQRQGFIREEEVMRPTWLSFLCRAHSSLPIVALRPPRRDDPVLERGPPILGSLGDCPPWSSFCSSISCGWPVGMPGLGAGAGAWDIAIAESCPSCPSPGGPRGCEDGPGSVMDGIPC